MQIMLPKSLGSASAVVLEVLSDTELRLKKEFGGDGKATSRIRVALKAARAEGKPGLSYRKIPFLDQQEMYHDVYECMKTRGCLAIFPEGNSLPRLCESSLTLCPCRWQS